MPSRCYFILDSALDSPSSICDIITEHAASEATTVIVPQQSSYAEYRFVQAGSSLAPTLQLNHEPIKPYCIAFIIKKVYIILLKFSYFVKAKVTKLIILAFIIIVNNLIMDVYFFILPQVFCLPGLLVQLISTHFLLP